MIKKLLTPGNDSVPTGLALLAARAWFGLTMLHHGVDKLTHFSAMSQKFPDFLHIGSAGNLALVIFAEVFCAGALALGLLTRFAALVLAINMTVAFVMAHGMKFSGEHSGELAFVYLGGYVALLLAGGGKFSADKSVFK